MRYVLLFAFCFLSARALAQLPDSCQLNIGTNLGGLADYGTELPFVDLMRSSREWYTKSIGDPNDPFDSGFADELTLRADGYPTHVPQVVDGTSYLQEVVTIWGRTDAWPVGKYTVLWEGTGQISLFGTFENLTNAGVRSMTFEMVNPTDGIVELSIEESDINDPIHGIHVLMPGSLATYETQPFNPVWTNQLDIFETVRFMDWGSTNGWGQIEEGEIGDSTRFDWSARSQMEYYTWTHSRGIPYEMMVQYMNDFDKDGWVCVPHTASDDYIRQMARFFRDELEPERHLYIEYSNEIWNWIFPQAHWTNEYGCIANDQPWPEGTVPFIQNVLDIWTEEFAGEAERLTRVVGVFTAWLDVAQRVAFNIDEDAYDVISPTYYFGFTEQAEEQLDGLGAAATVEDVVRLTRASMDEGFQHIASIKTELADQVEKPLAFYEGGQHLTPNPFGVIPTYERALLDVQRDTAMYNLYNEWFDRIRTVQTGEDPLLLMNFSFVAPRTAQFGSWGILETIDQDTSIIPAPKYQAVVENMGCTLVSSTRSTVLAPLAFQLAPNPAQTDFHLTGNFAQANVHIYDATGSLQHTQRIINGEQITIGLLPKGVYFVMVTDLKTGKMGSVKFVK